MGSDNREAPIRYLRHPAQMPTVSVLMPVFNAEHYVDDAVQSILRQSFPDFELLIIDDGSTDRTAEIVASIRDTRVRFLRNAANLGVSATLNRGLELARGEFIARMDADDVADPRRFELQVEHLRDHPDIALLGTGMTVFDDGGRILVVERPISDPDLVRWRSHFINQFNHPTVMFRRSALTDNDLRYGEAPAWATRHQPFVPATTETTEDYLLFGLLALRIPSSNLPKSLLSYRVHPKSWSHTQRTAQSRDEIRVCALLFSNILESDIPLDVAQSLFFTRARVINRSAADAACALIDRAVNAHERKFNLSPASRRLIRRDAHLRKSVIRASSRTFPSRLALLLRHPHVPRDMEELRLIVRLLVSEEFITAAKRLRTRALSTLLRQRGTPA